MLPGLLPSSRSISAVAVGVAIVTASLSPLPAESMTFRQYQTAADIPKEKFKSNDILYGKVIKVIDGDTVRVRHYPFFPFPIGKTYHGKLSEHTMSVRIYGVDCPETAKFGNPAMPKADEATAWTKKLVDDKIVRIKLLQRDQYNRAVAKITTRGFLPFTKTDVSVSLAEKGLATLYTGGGAQYDNKRELLEQKIETARRKRRGIWENGDNFVSPAEYKKQIKQGKKQKAAFHQAKVL